MNTEQIRKRIKSINPAKDYSTNEIVDLGVIFDTKNKSSIFTVLRLIRRGQLLAMNWGTDNKAQFMVRGKDLIDYLNKRYEVKAQVK